MTPRHSRTRAAAGSRRAEIALIAMLAMLATLVIAAPASAEPSEFCADDYDQPNAQLLSGDFGLPLWLGVESGAQTGRPDHVAVCYATGAPNESKTLGGAVGTYEQLGPGSVAVAVLMWSDSNSGIKNDTVIDASVSVAPTYAFSPGGASGGQAVEFAIPFSVCSGGCYSAPGGGVATTGLVVGTISQTPAPPGGVSAAYSVSNLCLTVNGIPVTSCGSPTDLPGVTTTGASPVAVGSPPGPCVVGVCVPVSPNIDWIGISGAQLATVYLPGMSPIPVYGVSRCLYQRTPADQCTA